MLRTWQDVVAKWRLVTAGDDDGPEMARDSAQRARSALLDGRLDDAMADFERAAELRGHAHDEVGIGDVLLARGRWQAAAKHYRRADSADPGNTLAALGLSQALVASGQAEAAAAELERVYGTPTDPVLRYYLASTWCSVAEQARGRTRDEVLVFTSEDQLATCESAARRILDLDVDDAELHRGAQRLLSEVAAGRRWQWRPEGLAVSLAVLSVSLGLILVAVGGLSGNVPLILLGIVLGSGLLYVIVVRFRRQEWRTRADALADQISENGDTRRPPQS